MPVKTSAMIEAGPASPERTAGSVKIPEPTMLPTTSAVAIQRPIERLRRGFALGALGTVSVSDDMIPPSSDAGGVRVHPKPVLDRHLPRGLTSTVGAWRV